MGQIAAPRKVASKRRSDAGPVVRAAKRKEMPAEIAAAQLIALLQADRWLFEASELAVSGGAEADAEKYMRIRYSIAECLARLQSGAYGALMCGAREKAVRAQLSVPGEAPKRRKK